jgi:hypothetical protein
MSARWNIIEAEGPSGNLVELLDLIYGVEDFGAVHGLDVIDSLLRYPRHAL